MNLKVSADLGIGSMADFCKAECAGDLVVGGLLLQTPVTLRPGSCILSLHRYIDIRYILFSLFRYVFILFQLSVTAAVKIKWLEHNHIYRNIYRFIE